jgi:hypothetical protein
MSNGPNGTRFRMFTRFERFGLTHNKNLFFGKRTLFVLDLNNLKAQPTPGNLHIHRQNSNRRHTSEAGNLPHNTSPYQATPSFPEKVESYTPK